MAFVKISEQSSLYNDLEKKSTREILTDINRIKHINKYLRSIDERLCFHSLRHTHATMLLEAGEDLELVSKRLGHASISTTAQVYSHILAKRQQAERDILDSIL